MRTTEIQFLLDYQKKERPAARGAFEASLASLLGRPVPPADGFPKQQVLKGNDVA
jgi:hypothetical protein